MSNIKELIRQKIDAYYAEYKAKFHQNGDSYHLGIIDGLDMAEQILDTLPDEPVSDCHDLEEAAEKYGSDYPAYNDDQFIAENAFKAGAEWMAKQLPLLEDTVLFPKGVEEGKRLMMEGATYNELMELYMAIRDEIIKRHRDAAVNIKEKTMDLKEDTGNESALHQIRG